MNQMTYSVSLALVGIAILVNLALNRNRPQLCHSAIQGYLWFFVAMTYISGG